MFVFRVALLFFALCGWGGSVLRGEPFPVPVDTQALDLPFPTARESLAKLSVPEGYVATVFAAEPDVANPVACTWDERGRLWVAENFTYGDNSERFNMSLRDRILIFEDTDNDGVHDRRTVFTDQVQMLTSVERGLGGVWAMAPPHLLFFPDANGDDVPDGPPQVVLDGFSTEAASRHTFANGLKWGPDGWLYGRIGISSTSYIGTPGSAPEQRVGTAGGLWRYHPVHKIVDAVCAGTTNPWGHDWDERGELFFINTVIGHLWHGIYGAHFKRMHGLDLNPRVYQQIDQIADHYHWDTGGQWQDSRPGALGADSPADALGGGHAHAGMMIYQGTNWPAEFRGKVFTLNLHGRRVNVERLEPSGSGFVGRHEPDILKSADPWFRGIEITYGPDGGVYILDWSDIGECHENDGVHRNSGRIFKITRGTPVRPPETNLAALSDDALVALHASDNEWLVRMARWQWRELRHRGRDMRAAETALARLGVQPPNLRLRRQALWTRVFSGSGLTPAEWAAALDASEVREAAVSLLGDAVLVASRTRRDSSSDLAAAWRPDTLPSDVLPEAVRRRLIEWAGDGGTPPLRLKLASFAIKNPGMAQALLEKLAAHAEDATDPSLPLLYWYAMMDGPLELMPGLFAACRIPLVRKFIARRCTEDIEKTPDALNRLLASGAHPADVLAGMSEALDGWAKAPRPDAWPAFVAGLTDAAQRQAAQSIDIVFGDGRALDEIRAIVLDGAADLPRRENALKALVAARADGLKDVCRRVLTIHGLSITAMQGLAQFDDPEIGRHLAGAYGSFYPHEQQALVDTLTTRPGFAAALLDRIRAGRIPRTALSPASARQIRAHNDESLNKALSEVWGDVRDSSEEKRRRIASLKARLTPEVLAQADPRQGRLVFSQVCASCHRLYGEGQLIGPDLTGGGRHDVNYLIENIIDPSALLAADYRMTVVTLEDGRVFSGNVAAQSERTLTLRMVGAEQTLERRQIAKIEQLPASLMPEGLLDGLAETQVRDLVRYLTGQSQVDLPDTGTGR